MNFIVDFFSLKPSFLKLYTLHNSAWSRNTVANGVYEMIKHCDLCATRRVCFFIILYAVYKESLIKRWLLMETSIFTDLLSKKLIDWKKLNFFHYSCWRWSIGRLSICSLFGGTVPLFWRMSCLKSWIYNFLNFFSWKVL